MCEFSSAITNLCRAQQVEAIRGPGHESQVVQPLTSATQSYITHKVNSIKFMNLAGLAEIYCSTNNSSGLGLAEMGPFSMGILTAF